jgi:hypothetical protein
MKKVAIHSVPRSGSTWLGEIFNSNPDVKYCFQPLFSYRFKDFLSNESERAELEEFFAILGETSDEFVCQLKERNVGSLPRFKKNSRVTHVVYKEVRYHHILEHICSLDKDLKIVLLVRDPVEVMNSWVNAPKEFDPTWNIEEELFKGGLKNEGRTENFYGLNAWIHTTKMFERLSYENKNQVILVNYSELTDSPIEVTKRVFNFCSLEYSSATEEFIKDSMQKKVEGTYSVFRGKEKSIVTMDDDLIESIRKKVMKADLSHYLNSINN